MDSLYFYAVKGLCRSSQRRFALHRLVPLLVLFAPPPATCQQTSQFWPEIDTYVKLNPTLRLLFIASTTQEAGDTIGSEFGANFDLFVKPLLKLKRFTVFELDESKSRLLTLRAGYHFLSTPGGPNETRIVLEATSRYPLRAGVLIADRNRADLRTIEGKFSWRYRNRLMLEKSFGIHSYHFTPYLRAEASYDSRVEKFSRTTEDVGFLFPIRRRAEIEPYYQHMNDTSTSPNRQTHGIGLTFNLYF